MSLRAAKPEAIQRLADMADKTFNEIISDELSKGEACDNGVLEAIHFLTGNSMPFEMWKNVEIFTSLTNRKFRDPENGE